MVELNSFTLISVLYWFKFNHPNHACHIQSIIFIELKLEVVVIFTGKKMSLIKMNHKLSSQAIGAIMMALQKSLIGQTDIVPILQRFEIQIDDSGQLVVMNPPTFEVTKGKSS